MTCCFAYGLMFQAAQAADKPLFDRLGGKAAITAVVEKFTAAQLADPRLSKYYTHTDKPKWRSHLVNLICSASGGPCEYKGRAMEKAHARLGLTKDEFTWTAEHLVAALNHFKVAPKDRDELVGIVASLQNKVVGQ